MFIVIIIMYIRKTTLKYLLYGFRYASSAHVKPRGRAFIIGITSEESDICLNPSSFAVLPTSSSCWRYTGECMNITEMASMPLSFSFLSFSSTSFCSIALTISTLSPVFPVTILPSEPSSSLTSRTLSLISMTVSYIFGGLFIVRSKICGLL